MAAGFGAAAGFSAYHTTELQSTSRQACVTGSAAWGYIGYSACSFHRGMLLPQGGRQDFHSDLTEALLNSD